MVERCAISETGTGGAYAPLSEAHSSRRYAPVVRVTEVGAALLVSVED